MMTTLLSTVLFLLLLDNLLLLGAPNLPRLIRFTAFQGALLAGLLVCFDYLALACAVLVIKGAILPYLLTRTRKRIKAHLGLQPRMSLSLEILAGLACLVFSLWLETRLTIHPDLFPALLLPTGLTTLFCGIILVVGRTTALSQIIGYLVAENGIFLLGVPLMTAGEVWFELALMLDVFVAVFVMGIAINHIDETFESIDVGRFGSLRD